MIRLGGGLGCDAMRCGGGGRMSRDRGGGMMLC